MDDHVIGVTVGLALAVGMISQSIARHLKLPGIVLLLAAGVLLGPDLANIIRPASLGGALQILVGFAVAVILFEGGMNLNLSRLAHQAHVIRRLLTTGTLITALGGALSARWLMGWSWEVSALFGTLIVVTGPTVIGPLLRRIKVQHKVETVLEAEAVLIDAVGAVAAVVALEIVLSLSTAQTSGVPWDAVWLLFARLGFGLLCGLGGGFLIALLLRFEEVVPKGLENVFTLSLVLALFQVSNFVIEESGIMTVVAAGIVVGNVRTRVQRDLMEFKEQLTVMLIGMLFVLLAAGVRLEGVQELGWRGIATVLSLMLIVRPINILLSTWGSDLTWQEKAFLAWLAPRGIIAAAVSSLFAQSLAANGIGGGESLQALVFMVIAVTVLVQGLSGGLVAQLLGLRRLTNQGFAILGANELGHALGRVLRDSGEEVVFVDSNPAACNVVKEDGFKVVYGNVLEERTLLRAQLDDRAACIAVTTNQEANLLFAQRAAKEFDVPRSYVALARGGTGVSSSVVSRAGAAVLFGLPRDLELWALRLRRGNASIEIWRYDEPPLQPPGDEEVESANPFVMPVARCLPLIVWRADAVMPANDVDGLRAGDVVHLALFNERLTETRSWLHEHGWRAAYSPEDEPQGVSTTLVQPSCFRSKIS